MSIKCPFGLFVLFALILSPFSVAADKPEPKDETAWHNPVKWGVEGKGYSDTIRDYDRYPAKAKETVRPSVWGLSRHSAGMVARFVTDSPMIKVRYELLSKNLGMPHMPATGVSGVDLYGRLPDGRWHWMSVTRPKSQKVEATLFGGLDGTMREYMLYLPLYNGVEKIEIGTKLGSTFKGLPPREKPIVFYGTSITQGGCASRPGMAYPAIVGRKLDRPTINLGFSGNALMEPEVAELLAELDPSIYILDPLPNMTDKLVAERAEPFVRTLRKSHPDVPIYLVEERTPGNWPFSKSGYKKHLAKRAELKKAYDRLIVDGVKNLYYVPGDRLVGTDGEAMVDGSHPTDLGMQRSADYLIEVITGKEAK
jgi:GDSL-like Lipase/Acylhydrolase family/N-terminus of Esterase_SGNH_hydro-type